eukprot:TRINITY_DN517_c0_g1_i1.p1 TRINITY_DN517_c0_g1~~TRINITY_DN517_c0_g1_i1.p1  ORF type:complete len:378 (-),score=128.15 TRINITY_DN517_c0_g1_i1:799-1932(-)
MGAKIKCSGAEIQRFLLKWFLPIGFAKAILIALAWPYPGATVGSWKVGHFKLVQTLNVMTVFFISGLGLKTADAKSAFSHEGWAAFAYGLVMILGVTPLAGLAAVRLPFEVPEFKYGMAVFCAVPTTIASGVALVNQADGNGALALLLTVASNLLGVVIVPFWVRWLLSSEDVHIDALRLLVNLLITVLAPLLAGQALRVARPRVQPWVARRRTQLKIVSNSSLVLIVWQTISRSAHEITSVSGGALASVIAAGTALHVSYLAVNYTLAAHVFKFRRPEMKAVVIMASEKTLPVSIAVIGFLTTLGAEGFLSIPAIVSQQVQLFMDAFIAGRWGDEAAADTEQGAVDPESEAERLPLLSEEEDEGGTGAIELGTVAS